MVYQLDIGKRLFYDKNPYKSKYQNLIKKQQGVSLKQFNDPKALIECSSDIKDAYKCFEEYSHGRRRRKVLILNTDMIRSKNLRPIPGAGN